MRKSCLLSAAVWTLALLLTPAAAVAQSEAERQQFLGTLKKAEALDLVFLGNLYLAMGQQARAEPLYLRSLHINEERLGKDHPEVADNLNNLASLYDQLGQYARAEPLYQRSLLIRETRLGKDNPAVAASLNNLANLYKHMGQIGNTAAAPGGAAADFPTGRTTRLSSRLTRA